MDWLGDFFSSLLEGFTSLFGENKAIKAQKEINQQNIDFAREQREYDKPVNAANRLRAAGINPALAGLDNAGGMSLPNLESSAPAIMDATKNVADAIQGFSGRNLDRQRLSVEEEHLRNVDDLAKMEFDNSSIKLAAELRDADDEHLSKMITNAENIDNMALASAISGRKPTGLPDDVQKRFDEAYGRISANDPDVLLAKAEFEKGTSAAEVESLVNRQRQRFYIDNPLDESMKVDLLCRQATEEANLYKVRLQNRGQELENDFAEQSFETRLSDLEAHANEFSEQSAENSEKRKNRQTRISELQEERLRLMYTIEKTHGPQKRALSIDLAKVETTLDLYYSGYRTDNEESTLMDVLSPYGGLAAGGVAAKKLLK